MLELPRCRAAAVQASPIFLDPEATIAKAVSLIREAARGISRFVPGYPYWSWITDPVTCSPWLDKLVRSSILVPGPEIDLVCKAAREAEVHVVIGVNERSPVSLGSLYNAPPPFRARFPM